MSRGIVKYEDMCTIVYKNCIHEGSKIENGVVSVKKDVVKEHGCKLISIKKRGECLVHLDSNCRRDLHLKGINLRSKKTLFRYRTWIQMW